MPPLSRTADRLERGLGGAPVTSVELTELVLLARALPPASRLVPGPSAAFVSRLGVQLREEAARRSVAPASTPPRRAPRVLHLGGRGLRLGLAALAVAVILLSGIGVASRSAVPGSLLYPVRELLDRVAVSLAGSPYDTGLTHLRQAEGHVRDARTLTAAHAPAGRVDVALTSAISNVQSAQREFALADAQDKTGRGLLALRDFAADVLPRLDALRPSVLPAARPALEDLAALLRPYAVGSGLPGTLPGGGSPATSSPTTATASSPPGSPPPSGIPSVPTGPNLPVNPSSPGAGVTLPGATVTVGPTGGGVVVTPTVGPVSPTVSITIAPPPGTVPTAPAPPPLAVGDTVTILAAPVAGVIGLEGTVVAVDAADGAVTVRVTTPLGLSTSVTVPYSSLRRS